MDIERLLIIVQMILAGLLTLTILLQQKSAGLSESLGGTQAMQTTRRGPEKFFFYATILCGIAFFGVSIAMIFLAV